MSRSAGCLLGLAAGNALGLPLEFSLTSADPPLTGIDPAEQRRPWDDDVAQAFELAESLAALRRVDAADLARRLLRWGRMNGRGMGVQTRQVLVLLEKGFSPADAGRIVWERSLGRAAGNGGVMRCAPAGVAFYDDPTAAAAAARDATAVTHFDPRCTQGAAAIAAAVAALLRGEPPLASAVAAVRAFPRPEPEVERALAGSPSIPLDGIPIRAAGAIGYTVTCLQAGFWALARPEPLETALLAVVNAGGDADTNGAVAGALLGARDGVEAIPARWLASIRDREKLETVAAALVRR